ncbi:MAG: NFACT family protein [Turicibacter sp.]|nr:NFACT family protein [Turicibacter sp.]
MPLDGVMLSGVRWEISDSLVGGRVDKIYQPDKNKIVINSRCKGKNYKLLLAVEANSPRVHLTNLSYENPLQAPMFCMLLRKHLSGGRVVEILQPDFERIIEISVESPNEMGDLSVKRLIVEIMGKHSNIILVDGNGTIMDSIRHVPRELSSVREILPGREYVRPPSQNKVPPLPIDENYFFGLLAGTANAALQNLLYQSYNGISPVLGSELCLRAEISPDTFVGMLNFEQKRRIFETFAALYDEVSKGAFSYAIYELDGGKRDFSALPLELYAKFEKIVFESPSQMLEEHYKNQDLHYRMKQKTADLLKVVGNHMERCKRKALTHEETLRKAKDRDKLRHKGELLTAYIHNVPPRADRVILPDFYSDEEVEIALNPEATPAENAQQYFKRYNKAKRAYAAAEEQKAINAENIAYLDSVLASIGVAANDEDIAEIRAELAEQGFLKRVQKNKLKNIRKSKPLHYLSSDGFDIFVGKNNTQNDILTMKTARPTDIWLHTKDIAGSHVIIQSAGKEVPHSTILEGAKLAAYHSKGRMSNQVPVDYCPRKQVKKPNGAKPGFVIYDFYRTVYVTPEDRETLP